MNHKDLIEQKAELIKQEFIDAANRKLASGAVDKESVELNHGNNGLAPIHLSALNEILSHQRRMMTLAALRESKNIDCF